MLLCAAPLVVGVVLLASGVGAVAFLPLVACMLMIVVHDAAARAMTAATAEGGECSRGAP